MKIKFTYPVFVILSIATGCTSKESKEWPMLDAFHTVMAESYHPLKDSSNLVPAKSNAEGMATLASEWAAADLPDKVDNDDMRKLLAILKVNSRAFADQVSQNAPDSVLSIALENLHTDFHHVAEAWEKSDSEGHDHH